MYSGRTILNNSRTNVRFAQRLGPGSPGWALAAAIMILNEVVKQPKLAEVVWKSPEQRPGRDCNPSG